MLIIRETTSSSVSISNRQDDGGKETGLIFALHNYDKNIFLWERVERCRRLSKRLAYGLMTYVPFGVSAEGLINDFLDNGKR